MTVRRVTHVVHVIQLDRGAEEKNSVRRRRDAVGRATRPGAIRHQRRVGRGMLLRPRPCPWRRRYLPHQRWPPRRLLRRGCRRFHRFRPVPAAPVPPPRPPLPAPPPLPAVAGAPPVDVPPAEARSAGGVRAAATRSERAARRGCAARRGRTTKIRTTAGVAPGGAFRPAPTSSRRTSGFSRRIAAGNHEKGYRTLDQGRDGTRRHARQLVACESTSFEHPVSLFQFCLMYSLQSGTGVPSVALVHVPASCNGG